MRALGLILACRPPEGDDAVHDSEPEETVDPCGARGEREGAVEDARPNSNRPLLWEVAIECDDGRCVYTAVADADVGDVALYMVHTGDSSFEEGCPESGQAPAGDLVCGVWSEHHADFRLTDGDHDDNGGDTLVLELDIVEDTACAVQDETTRFDFERGNFSRATTVMWVITDSDGNYSDCATYGDDPTYFEDACDNDWN